MRALEMSREETPPAEAIWSAVRPMLADITVMGPQLLLGLYHRAEKTAGGIYLPDRTKDEDIYQGKVGLVLAIGPLAFQEDENHKWGTRVPQIGDWVGFRISDGWPMILGKQHCRMVEDVNVRFIVQHPDVIY